MIYDGGSCNFMFHLAGTTLKIRSSYQIYWQLQLDYRKRSTWQERSPVGPTSVKLSDPARWPVSLYCIYLCIDHLYFQHPEGTERKCIYVLQQHHQILHWHLQQPESHQTSLKNRIQSVSQWECRPGNDRTQILEIKLHSEEEGGERNRHGTQTPLPLGRLGLSDRILLLGQKNTAETRKYRMVYFMFIKIRVSVFMVRKG